MINIKIAGLTLVDVYGEWCGPCQRFLKVWPRLAEELGGRIEFIKVDMDTDPSAPELIEKYNIRSVPTFLLFKDGELVEQWSGVKSLLEMKRIIEKWETEETR